MAPIATLTVRLSAQIAEFQSEFREASRTADKFQQDFLGTATKASAFGNIIADGVGRAVNAFENMARRAFETAGRVKDLSTQLGISTDAVQGFKEAAELAGSSMDAVGVAINKMNQNLAGGDKATVQALRDAGLEFRNIRSMKPEDAFLAITDAIKEIPDPMTQADVAMQIFGKSAAQLLPAIKEGFRETADAASKMSQDTIERLEKAGDAWQSLANRVTIWTGEIIAHVHKMFSQPPGEDVYFQKWMDALHLDTKEAKEQLQDLGRVLDTLRGKMEKLPQPKALTKPAPAGVELPNLSVNELLAIGDALDEERQKRERSTEETRRHNYELSRAVEKTQEYGLTVDQDMIPQVRRLGTEIPISTAGLSALADAIDRVQNLSKNGIIPDAPARLGVDVGLPTIPGQTTSTRTSLFGSPQQIGQQLAASIIGAFQGGGSAVQSAVGQLGATVAGNFGKSLTEKGGPLFNKALGDIFAGALPVVGSLIGPLVGKIWGSLFGTEGRDTKNAMAEQLFGGVKQMQELMVSTLTKSQYDSLWKQFSEVGQNNKKQAEAAIQAIVAALEAQKQKEVEVAAAAAASAEAQKNALDEIGAKYKTEIDKLESEWKTLADSVAKEAEEEHMGITETLERERMKQLEDQKKALEAQRDAEIEAKKETFAETLEAGRELDRELRETFERGYKIPIRFEFPDGMPPYVSPSALTSNYTSGMTSGWESRVPSSALTGGGGGTAQFYADGRLLAEMVVPNIPGEVKRLGLNR